MLKQNSILRFNFTKKETIHTKDSDFCNIGPDIAINT